MIAPLLWLFAIVFVVVTLPGALRRNARSRRHRIVGENLIEPSQKRDSLWWQKEPPHCLTAADYYEALDRHERDSAHHPSPMRPPSMRDDE